MQYPGTSPFSGFGGSNALTSQLTPTSLEQRKRQLVHQLVTGGGSSQLTVGAGQGDSAGRQPGLSFNPFFQAYLHSLGAGNPGNQGGSFFGNGGIPSPGNPPGGNPASPAAQAAAASLGAPATAPTNPSGVAVNTPTYGSGSSRMLFGNEGMIGGASPDAAHLAQIIQYLKNPTGL